jgi:two-component system response regulator YesN
MHLVEQISTEDNAQMILRERIRIFMSDNLHRGLTLKDLSAFLGYSEKYCSELFLKVMGEPFSRWLKQLRVREASRLLADSPASLTDIAESLGFSDQFVFSHFFKKTVGCSPRQFRTRLPEPVIHKTPARHHTATGGRRPIRVRRADVPSSGV